MRTERTLLATLAAVLLAAPAAAAQEPVPAPNIYRREVFSYPGRGRPDPFTSLLGSADLGVRFQDLALRSVIHSPEPGQSVVVLAEAGSERRIRARVGQRIGGITVLAIYPRRVDLLVEEFGVARRESLELKSEPKTGAES
jgi:hypothetical protein